MKNLFNGKSWKTSIAGLLVVLIGAATYLNWITEETATAITTVLVALGFMASKDSNVTGGSVKQ